MSREEKKWKVPLSNLISKGHSRTDLEIFDATYLLKALVYQWRTRIDTFSLVQIMLSS